MVAGHAAMFAVASVIAVAVGSLIRQSAGAIAILLLWPLLLENLLGAIPALNEASQWFPFTAGARFVASTSNDAFDFRPVERSDAGAGSADLHRYRCRALAGRAGDAQAPGRLAPHIDQHDSDPTAVQCMR